MKKKIMIAVTIFSISISKGQFTSENINNQLVSKFIRNICADASGNIVITGSFSSSLTLGSFTVTSNYQSAQFIAKKSTNGSFVWATTINPIPVSNYSSNVYIFDVHADSFGNTYVTGGFWGKVNFGNIILTSTKQGTRYTEDMFTTKISPQGTFLWARLEGTAEETGWGGEPGISVTTDTQGNVITTGRIVSKILKNSGNCSLSSNSPVFCVYIVKYSPVGTKIWEKKFAPPLPSRNYCGYQYLNYGASVECDGSNIYVAGSFHDTVSFGGVTLATGSDTTRNTFLMKLNQSGSTVWANSVTNSGNGPGGLLLDNNGNDIYLEGYFVSGTISFGGPSLTTNLVTRFLAKYSTSGACSWAVNAGVYDPRSSGPFKHPNGTIGMLLISPSHISAPPNYFGIKEYSVDNGSIVNSTDAIINLPIISTNERIAVTPTGFVYGQNLKGLYDIGGTTVSSTQEVGGNYSDIMLVTYTAPAPPIAHPENILSESSLSKMVLYPNPTNNQITIKNSTNKILGDLTMYDVSGKMVYKKFIGNSQTIIDVKSFLSGFYYIRSDQLQTTIKFVKQ